MSQFHEDSIYNGHRGESFKQLIVSLLKRSKISSSRIERFTDDESMKLYDQAFTACSANSSNNYEMFEQLGDVTANKFIVWYMYRRFPQLYTTKGVKVVARLRIKYGARQSFSDVGSRLGFWDFISASQEDRDRKKKDLLEDCVESFVGVTEFIIDKQNMIGVGNAVVYDILKSIFDEMSISLKYEDLYDPKTRLKELFDCFKSELGSLKYTNTRDIETGIFTACAQISNSKCLKTGIVGSGCASKLKDAEQKAAQNALNTINSFGYVKPVPPEYAEFDR